jgi:hypothetical protein
MTAGWLIYLDLKNAWRHRYPAPPIGPRRLPMHFARAFPALIAKCNQATHRTAIGNDRLHTNADHEINVIAINAIRGFVINQHFSVRFRTLGIAAAMPLR